MSEEGKLDEIKNLLDPEDKEEFSHEKILEEMPIPDEVGAKYSLESNIISGYEINVKDGRLSITSRIDATEFNPKLASGIDFVQMFSAIYETMYRVVEDRIDPKNGGFEELEINIEDRLQSCYMIKTSEIGDIPLERKNIIKRDYLSPKSSYNQTKLYKKHLVDNLGRTNDERYE